MRRLFYALLIPLAACATPKEQCLTDLTKNANALDALIAQTAGNIERGYAVKTRNPVTIGLNLCTSPSNNFYFCASTRSRPNSSPTPIDIEFERRKLAALKAKRAENRRQLASDTAACKAL